MEYKYKIGDKVYYCNTLVEIIGLLDEGFGPQYLVKASIYPFKTKPIESYLSLIPDREIKKY